jgi:hypothetical protein
MLPAECGAAPHAAAAPLPPWADDAMTLSMDGLDLETMLDMAADDGGEAAGSAQSSPSDGGHGADALFLTGYLAALEGGDTAGRPPPVTSGVAPAAASRARPPSAGAGATPSSAAVEAQRRRRARQREQLASLERDVARERARADAAEAALGAAHLELAALRGRGGAAPAMLPPVSAVAAAAAPWLAAASPAPAPVIDPESAHAAHVAALRGLVERGGLRGARPEDVDPAVAAAAAALVAAGAAARAAAARAAARAPGAAPSRAACGAPPRRGGGEDAAAAALALDGGQVAALATLAAATHARLASLFAERKRLNASLPALLAAGDAASADAALASLRRNLRGEAAARGAADHAALYRVLAPTQAAVALVACWPGTVDALELARATVPGARD